jgi:thioredoxin:protein disulfide reductase
MRSVHLALATLLLGCATGGQGTTADHPTLLADRIDAANRAGQPLVVEFGATWCKPCHAFADHVLTDPRVQAELRGVAFVQYDIDTPAGADAMRRCQIAGVPAVVGVEHDGSVRPMKAGVEPTVDEFVAFLRDAKLATRP